MYNIFIDGKEGTTGLQIYDRLAARSDINLITLPEELRKDRDARRECLNRADISFLCLPDAAAVEAVSLVENERSRIIDASTAHRTSPGWVYGFAELSAKKRAEIAAADRVANPGCYATGFISLVAPLVAGGIASPEYPFVCHALSGYSGAGKKGIAQYLSPERDRELDSPRHYALGQRHKHLPEMVAVCGLKAVPIFSPVICDYYAGMCVAVPIHASLLSKKYNLNDLHKYFTQYYAPDYAPAIGQFYLQNPETKYKLGGYPLVNAYINLHLKRTRFFLMMYNLVQGTGERSYFFAPHYPLNPRGLKLGLSWNFFD